MISVVISKEWFDEIKANVYNRNALHFMENGRAYVEVDVAEDQFNRVSAEKGWM